MGGYFLGIFSYPNLSSSILELTFQSPNSKTNIT